MSIQVEEQQVFVYHDDDDEDEDDGHQIEEEDAIEHRNGESVNEFHNNNLMKTGMSFGDIQGGAG